MTITFSIGDSNSEEYTEIIAKAIWSCKRCIVVTGAGISVMGGIPDFRSKNGIYQDLKKKHPNIISKGQDLFDYQVFRDQRLTSVFYQFIAELRNTVKSANATKVHEFIKRLDDRKQLLRCYTQNIDCLELRLKMSSDLDNLQTLRIVQLHGDLEHVICNICMSVYNFHDDICKEFSTGQAPTCPKCSECGQVREAAGKRKVSVGFLRPNIVLYNECHNKGEQIAELAFRDARMRPDMLLVLGTSLSVDGIKKLVRYLAKVVKSHKCGCVVFINSMQVGRKSEWSNVFDYHIVGDAVSAVDHLETIISSLIVQKEQRALKLKRITASKSQK